MPRKIKRKSIAKPKPLKPKLNTAIALEIRQDLVNNGYKGLQLNLLMAQAAHESNGFTFEKALTNHNFGGIKYYSTLKNSAKMSTNFSAPGNEEKHNRRIAYASFQDNNDFAKKWAQVGNLRKALKKNNIGAPLDATNIEDYVHRLKLNYYFGDPESVYINGMKKWSVILQNELASYNNISNGPPIFLPKTNFADNLHIATPIIDPSKNLSPAIRKIVPDNEHRQNLPLYPLGWKFSTDQEGGKSPNDSNKVIFDPFKVYRYDSPSIMDFHKEMKSSLMEYPALMNSHLGPALQRPASGLYSLPASNTVREQPAFSFLERSGSSGLPVDPENDGFEVARQYNYNREPAKRSDSSGRMVNVNLNTPLIGNLTMSTTQTMNSLDDLRSKVEEVLLEVLNSANAIS